MNGYSDEAIVPCKLRLCGAALPPKSLSPRRRLFAHQRLHQEPLQLSVLKLDGSCFDIWVRKKATVAELKHAVQDVFMLSAMDAQLVISWSHVWGNFCLSHKDQKLMDDKTRIHFFGIKDGDQKLENGRASAQTIYAKTMKSRTPICQAHLNLQYAKNGQRSFGGFNSINSVSILTLYSSFTRDIPQELGLFHRLEKLGLPNNTFSGEIPMKISRSSNPFVG